MSVEATVPGGEMMEVDVHGLQMAVAVPDDIRVGETFTFQSPAPGRRSGAEQPQSAVSDSPGATGGLLSPGYDTATFMAPPLRDVARLPCATDGTGGSRGDVDHDAEHTPNVRPMTAVISQSPERPLRGHSSALSLNTSLNVSFNASQFSVAEALGAVAQASRRRSHSKKLQRAITTPRSLNGRLK